MAIRLGMRGVLNIKVGGVAAGGAWTAIPIVRDLTLNITAGEADATTRGNNGWQATVATLLDASVDFEIVHDPTNAGYQALRDAALAREPIGMQVLDEDGGEGLQADMMITSFSRGEGLQDNMTISVTAKPTLSDTAPEWIEATEPDPEP